MSFTPKHPVDGRPPRLRGSVGRKEALDERELELEGERNRKKIHTELREACTEMRNLAERMATTKPFELSTNTLHEWSSVVSDQLAHIEAGIMHLTSPPSIPLNTIASKGLETMEPPSSPRSVDVTSPTSCAPSATVLASTAASPSPTVARPISSTSSVTSALYLILEAACHHLRAERCIAYQYDGRTDELQPVCYVNTGMGIEGGPWGGGLFALNLTFTL